MAKFGCSDCGGDTVKDGARCPWCWRGFDRGDTETVDTTSCVVCGRIGCKVEEAFMQATRWEPMTSLGFQAWCPDCKVTFKVAGVTQLAIA